uniref:Tetratricopeptide repeat protein n=1 Tax=Panagrolaimus sp. JU765 TaxID=591449 RepID=A0AC34QBB7_9BILA
MTSRSQPDSLFSLFTELHDANVSGDYASVLKIANEIVSSYPHEILAFKAKLFALIKLGRFDEASKFMNEVPVDHIE